MRTKLCRYALVCSAHISLCLAQAHAVTITIPYHNPNDKNAKDFVVKFNDTVTHIVDNGHFDTPAESTNPNRKTIKFDGGNIPKCTSGSVIVETGGASTTYQILKASYTDGSTRATSRGDDINSKVVYGGELGISFLGVDIMPFTYGYFYQFDRNASYASSPETFQLKINSPLPPLNYGVVLATFSSAIYDDLDNGPFEDDMTASNLTTNPGKSPKSWDYDSVRRLMVADFSTVDFDVGDDSSILWYIHPDPPALGALVGLDNATITGAGGSVLFQNSVDTPFIPEPATMLGVFLGVSGMGAYLRKRVKAAA